MPPKKTEREWLKGHFEAMTAKAAQVKHLEPEVLEDAPMWSLLKHATMRDLLGMYLTIMSKQTWCRRKVFIDTNSSSGLSRLRSTKHTLIGSALLGATTETPFDHYYFNEPDAVKHRALSDRLAAILPHGKFTVLSTSADDAIATIVPRLPARDAHYFAVLDPYTVNLSWKAFAALCSRPGDILYNFQTTHVKRVTPHIAEACWGTAAVHELRGRNAPEEEIIDGFIERVKTARPVTAVFRVRDGKTRYYYDFIYAVAGTKGSNPWMKHAQRLQERLGHLTGRDVAHVLGTASLDDFGED